MTAPIFQPGQWVRIADRTPPVHHRVPTYAKGRKGIIERVCGLHGTPENFIRGDGRPLRRLYRVRIAQNTLWQDYSGNSADVVDVEIFEHWLESAE